jgi:hypothetical protein
MSAGEGLLGMNASAPLEATMVESTVRYSKSGSSQVASKMRHQTPLDRPQRRKTRLQYPRRSPEDRAGEGPYAGSTSTPFTNIRLSRPVEPSGRRRVAQNQTVDHTQDCLQMGVPGVHTTWRPKPVEIDIWFEPTQRTEGERHRDWVCYHFDTIRGRRGRYQTVKASHESRTKSFRSISTATKDSRQRTAKPRTPVQFRSWPALT